jgi:hypothetical protein
MNEDQSPTDETRPISELNEMEIEVMREDLFSQLRKLNKGGRSYPQAFNRIIEQLEETKKRLAVLAMPIVKIKKRPAV